MILQALNQYYEALAQDDKIPRPGWAKTGVSYALSISEDGELKQVIPLLSYTDGKKPQPQQKKLPAPALRHGSGFTSNFIWDNSSYLLGVDNKGKPERRVRCF